FIRELTGGPAAGVFSTALRAGPSVRPATAASDAAAFRRAAAVMRDRRHVADRGDLKPDPLQCAEGRLPARTPPPHPSVRRGPGPFTSMSRVRMPCSIALRPASSAATWAAYGVDFREPLNPWLPEDDHAIVLPWASVIVIIVLLNVAATCAVPEVMFLRSRRRR